MCLAVQQMIDEATVGIRQEERREGRREGILEGKKQGKISNLFDNVKNLMQNMHLSREECMEVLCVSEEDRKELNKLLN